MNSKETRLITQIYYSSLAVLYLAVIVAVVCSSLMKEHSGLFISVGIWTFYIGLWFILPVTLLLLIIASVTNFFNLGLKKGLQQTNLMTLFLLLLFGILFLMGQLKELFPNS